MWHAQGNVEKKVEIICIIVQHGSPFKAKVTDVTLWSWPFATMESLAPPSQAGPLRLKQGPCGRLAWEPQLRPSAFDLQQACLV